MTANQTLAPAAAPPGLVSASPRLQMWTPRTPRGVGRGRGGGGGRGMCVCENARASHEPETDQSGTRTGSAHLSIVHFLTKSACVCLCVRVCVCVPVRACAWLGAPGFRHTAVVLIAVRLSFLYTFNFCPFTSLAVSRFYPPPHPLSPTPLLPPVWAICRWGQSVPPPPLPSPSEIIPFFFLCLC